MVTDIEKLESVLTQERAAKNYESERVLYEDKLSNLMRERDGARCWAYELDQANTELNWTITNLELERNRLTAQLNDALRNNAALHDKVLAAEQRAECAERNTAEWLAKISGLEGAQ